MNSLKQRLYDFLRWSEAHTKTDMVYLSRSGFWVNLGSVSISLFSFVLYLAFARFLPPEVYGTYQYLLSLSTVVGALTLVGMNGAAARAVARGAEGTVRVAVITQLRWSIVPLMVAAAGGLYYFMQGNVLLGTGLILIGAFVPINNAFNTYAALPAGRGDFKQLFLLSLFNSSLYYPALIVAAFFSNAALLLLFANLASQAIAVVLASIWIRRTYRPNPTVDPDSLVYGKHLSAMGFASTAITQLDNLLVFHFLGAAPLALYSFATAVPDRIAGLMKFLPAAVVPRLSSRSPAEIAASLRGRIGWAVGVSALLAIGYTLIAYPLFLFFFPAYITAVPYSMLCAAMIVPAVSTVLVSALTAGRRTRALYLLNTSTPLLQLALQLTGILFAGLWGLIVARLCVAVIHFAVSAAFVFAPFRKAA